MDSISTPGLLVWKLCAQLLLPEGLLLLLLVASLLAVSGGRRRVAMTLGAAGLAVYAVSAAPVFAAWLAGTLERQHPIVDIAKVPRAEVAIVLGGAVQPAAPPRLSVELTESSDRVWHAVRLYRAGRIERIIVVGGNMPWSANVEPEAQAIKTLMIDWGVPEAAISVGPRSRNTRENALEAAALLRERPAGRILLVTSAMHMPRSLAVFSAAGLAVEPSVCDIRATDHITGTVLDWLPSARAFWVTSEAAREWLGLLAYRLRGWL